MSVILTGEEVVPFTDGFQPFPARLNAKVRFTETGLVFSGDPLSWDEWLGLGLYIRSVERSLHWIIGDWLIYGEHTFGEKYAQAEADTGFSVETLKRDFWVASRFPHEARQEGLSFSHYVAVASLPPDARTTLISKAAENKLSSRELKETVRVYKGVEPKPASVGEVTLPEGAEVQSITINLHEGFTPRTEPSVIGPAVFDSHPLKTLPYPREINREYEYRFYEVRSPLAEIACAACGSKPTKADTGSVIVRLTREEMLPKDAQATGETVEIVCCLSCLFDIVQAAGVQGEVFSE